MDDYVKPSLWSSLNHFILHASTNDLSSDKWSEEIARSTINLTTSIKDKKHVSIFNIIIQTGGKQSEEKTVEVNNCEEKNYYLIDNSKRIQRNYLNKNSYIYIKHRVTITPSIKKLRSC